MNAVLVRVTEITKSPTLWVKYDSRGSVREITCKGCGAKIAGMIISDDEPRQVIMNEKAITVAGMEFTHLSNYAEGLMEFDDNSAHVTSGCKGCVGKLKRAEEPGKLMSWYEQDLASWLKEIQIAGKGTLHPRLLNRTPVRMI